MPEPTEHIPPPSALPAPTPPWWRRVLSWMSPLRLWREIRESNEGHKTTAVGFAAGVFIANTPLWGLHTVLAIAAAKRFKLHPLTVTAGTAVGTPPIGPVLIAGAVSTGHYILHGVWPTAELVRTFLHPPKGELLERFREFMEEWCIGSVIIGLLTAAIAYVVIMLALKLVPIREKPGLSAPPPPDPTP